MPCRMLYYLKQETPIIHFQYHEPGATLRASDVKPRLDRFLIGQMKEEQIDFRKYLKSPADPEEESDKIALDYKMQIVARGVPKITNWMLLEEANRTWREEKKKRRYDAPRSEQERRAESQSRDNTIGGSYFGNMISSDDEKKYGGKKAAQNMKYKEALSYQEPIEIRIVCFHSELRKVIDDHIDLFFFLNNFGTRKDKGFGSFSVLDKSKGKSRRSVEDLLPGYLCRHEEICVYQIRNQGRKNQRQKNQKQNLLADADIFYKLIKSGINYKTTYKKSLLTCYMLGEPCGSEGRQTAESDNAPGKRIGGEKRWMKRTGLGPAIGNSAGEKKHDPLDIGDYRYIRALFGTTDGQKWLKNLYNRRDKASISIKPGKDNPIERFASPIAFIVFNGTLYLIACDPAAVIFDQTYQFSSDFNGRKSKNLKTPAKNEFVMGRFMDFVNSKINGMDEFQYLNRSYQFSMEEVK